MAVAVAAIAASIAATPLNDIPGTTEMYSAEETDARIAELGGAGDYATVSNAAVNAGWRATNYTDYAVLRLSQTNSVLSGGPYVTPSGMEDCVTNALSGIAADRITDGTNTIDAARNVYATSRNWQFTGQRDDDYISLTYESDAWTMMVYSDSLGTDMSSIVTNENVTRLVFNFPDGGRAYSITAVRDVPTYVGRVALTNDIPDVSDADLTPATNYTDYAVVRLSQTNSVLSGGPYQTKLPYPTNAVPYSAISDAPPAVDVVSPSTNATVGTAADAKSTGTALYTGFTEWVCDSISKGWTFISCEWIADPPEGLEAGWVATVRNGPFLSSDVFLGSDASSVSLSNSENLPALSLSRHLITPTKTSQLVNDGSNGVPFAVVTQLGTKQDALPYPTNAIPYAAISGAPSLAGQTFDFSRNYDIIRATAAIAEALGATITNNPTAQGGN